MTNKFDNVPIEEDTKIKYSAITKFGNYDVRYERWFWEVIYAESLIFFNDDIKGVSEEELKNEILNSPLVEAGSDITVKRSEPYTFFNFNFKDAMTTESLQHE